MTRNEAIEKIKELRVKIKAQHMCKSMDGDCTEEDVQEYRNEFKALQMAEEALRDVPDTNVVDMQCKYVAMNCGRDCANCWKFELIKPRWIPCSERLPEERSNVIMSLEWQEVVIGYRESRKWYTHDDGEVIRYYTEDVIAWMPLPEPYKEENNG